MNLDTPCLHWDGYVDPKGYGRLGVNGKRFLAHRYSYQLVNGEIPKGLVIDHMCHNIDQNCPGGTLCGHRKCVNPEHLEVITPAENNRRGRVNSTKTHCKQGHPFNEANTYVASRGSRECRACNAARFRARNTSHAETA